MTGACDWFVREGALALERGELDKRHLFSCTDCRTAHASYLAVARAVAAIRAPRQAPPGWEARLGRALAVRVEEGARRRRRLRIAGAVTVTTLAAAVVVIVAAMGRGPGAESDPDRALELRAAPTLVLLAVRKPDEKRTASTGSGDHLRIRATAGGDRHAELRVYRAGTELVLRCAPALVPPIPLVAPVPLSALATLAGSAAPCSRDGDHLAAELALPSAGLYRVALVTGAQPPPSPAGSLDADLAAARRAGSRVTLSEPLDVQ